MVKIKCIISKKNNRPYYCLVVDGVIVTFDIYVICQVARCKRAVLDEIMTEGEYIVE
ncbi:MAG: hypothetical protein IJ301_04405 [Clostridia bacterium]|nr:hypothetical protein [Clostridia bacterium]